LGISKRLRQWRGFCIGRSKDHTLFAKIGGRVQFVDRGNNGRFVSIDPVAA
jgi:large subunit ribosomal protein L27